MKSVSQSVTDGIRGPNGPFDSEGKKFGAKILREGYVLEMLMHLKQSCLIHLIYLNDINASRTWGFVIMELECNKAVQIEN